jgi:hypothetical protein
MFLLRGKNGKSPFVLLTMILLLFGRKKTIEDEASPRPLEPFPVPDVVKKTITEYDVGRAKDRLRIASLERDIISGALTTIYEAEARGQVNESERNQLLQHYKVDLKRVDSEIDTYKKVVDLHELESAKEDLLKSFHEKLMEIDVRINQIKPSLGQLVPSEPTPQPPTQAPVKPDTPAEKQDQATVKEKSKERPKNKAEERLEAIRDEVLQAMERLEQIETEG